jgi:8-oxo-dGTP pyrophosphatase MutT (NUDIX family)
VTLAAPTDRPGQRTNRRPGGAQVIPRPDVWTELTPAPWDGRKLEVPTVALVLDRLGSHMRPKPFEPRFEGARFSSVLILLVDGQQGAEVLLTRRAMHLSSHRGEISFPGGRMDPGETAVETALREAHEEVLLASGSVVVHGELDHLNTVVSNSYIVPVVAATAERPTVSPGTSEVDRVFFVPLVELTRSDTYHQERWGTPPMDRDLHFFELDDETVWGATGRILVQLLGLTHRVPVPPAWI